MAAKVGITIVKKFTYRGDPTEEFSNTYHLTGAVPADDAAWRTLFDALVAQEKTVYSATNTVIRGYGYATDNPDDNSVWSVNLDGSTGFLPVAGTLTVTSATPAPGDCAVWVRWKTSRLNSKGKAIYLRKYFHGVWLNSGTADDVMTGQKTALAAFGTKLRDGSFVDGRTITAQTHTDTILSSSASSYATTRTLKRRGKRPGA